MRRVLPLWTRSALVIAVLPLLVGLTYANYRFALRAAGGDDLLPRWVGAQSWVREGLSPYDPAVAITAQRMIYGRVADASRGEELALFAYPFPAMIFFAPLGLVPYAVARALWMTILEVSLPLTALLGLRMARWRANLGSAAPLFVLAVVWFNGFRAIVLGQFAVVETLLLTGAIAALDCRRDVVAGVLVALSLAKPQLALLFIVFSIVWAISLRRWAYLLSAVLASTAILALSLAVLPDWPVEWLRQVVADPRSADLGGLFAPQPSAVPPGLGIACGIALILLALWGWSRAWGRAGGWFVWTAALTLVVTQVTILRLGAAEVMLLPGWVLILASVDGRWGRQGRGAVLSLILALVVLPWLVLSRSLLGGADGLRAYAALPVASLLGLLWVRWWVTRGAGLRLEGHTSNGVDGA